MKHYEELEWNSEMAAKKPMFVWHNDMDKFSLPVKARKALAKHNNIRACNVSTFDVIITVLKTIFKGY
jgi:hypothetical protein